MVNGKKTVNRILYALGSDKAITGKKYAYPPFYV